MLTNLGVPVGDETIPFMVIALLGTGLYLTVRLGFIQLKRLGHGFGVTSGKYDDPNEPGDVSHFQALTTALSATVGIGNIAGVAIAIHYGGPGALFWMWVTAFFGMAVKYTEVTLALRYRDERPDKDARKWEGSVSGGPMYYIERGLGPKWKPLAIFFAVLLGFTAFLTGNGIQANTLADTMETSRWAISPYVTGAVSATIVGLVIIGGIQRIGRVTSILAPLMAAIYVFGALLVIVLNIGEVVPTFALIFREAFNPTAGVAGAGMGAFVVTLMWGVRRGLFSNEAGQGSAPIAHAAAKTDEPVSEGVVALLEPFIDTIVICTLTGMVVIMTAVWDDKHPTELALTSGDISYVAADAEGRIRATNTPAQIEIANGNPVAAGIGDARFAWHDATVDRFFVDENQTVPFTGVIRPADGMAVDADGAEFRSLWGDAVETGAPLTIMGFERGLANIPGLGGWIVMMGVILFSISTAIAWSYYGDRCANYIFGSRAILPYRMVYVIMHYVGAVVPLAALWDLGDVFLAIVILPNLLALLLLSGQVAEMSKSYFERKPWEENELVHQRLKEERKHR
ncbi:MAG: sodium:alanine symporter family protein [Gemmatimonadota bacterium]